MQSKINNTFYHIMNNPFQNAMSQLDRAIQVKKFDEKFLKTISRPNRQIKISIPVILDNGELEVFEGYRVQYNNARGPYKGGIRYHPDTDIEEVKALAFWMALKCAVANIPMGGGKGGITVDPKKLSKKELESLSRGWIKLMSPIIGPHIDVPAPDVNTTPQIMAWMVDEYSKITGDTTNAVITGKPIEIGGSEGRGPATGLGGFYVFDFIKSKLNLPTSCRIVIQGFGNVGGNAAEILSNHGHHIIAISDSKGAIYKEDGINIKDLNEYKKINGHISDFPGSKNITNEELLTTMCDVLIPAALENQITDQNAYQINTKLIIELANGPTTPLADDILYERNIPVIPDILANAGGVTVSTFEWQQNLKKEHWTEVEVYTKLKKIMEEETEIIWQKAVELKTDIRRAAFIIALERIQDAAKYND